MDLFEREERPWQLADYEWDAQRLQLSRKGGRQLLRSARRALFAGHAGYPAPAARAAAGPAGHTQRRSDHGLPPAA
jgi:hypothetical protein